jgi:hypothetical protein
MWMLWMDGIMMLTRVIANKSAAVSCSLKKLDNKESNETQANGPVASGGSEQCTYRQGNRRVETFLLGLGYSLTLARRAGRRDQEETVDGPVLMANSSRTEHCW